MTNKSIVLAASILLVIGSAAAVVGQEEPDDGEMAITSGQSASASSSVTQNGTEWRAEVSMTGNSTEDIEDAVLNPEYSENEFKIVNFEGRITAPTPCHVLEHEVNKTSENSYILNVQTVDTSDGVCAQVVTGINYNASFETQDTFDLEVQHDGETVDTLEYPEEDTSEDGESDGIFQGFVTWLRGLF